VSFVDIDLSKRDIVPKYLKLIVEFRVNVLHPDEGHREDNSVNKLYRNIGKGAG
jgi:hypothetical protein